MGQLVDLTGKKFGRLTVVRRAGSTTNKAATWLCLCDCGNEKVVSSTHLISGATTSCGCYQKQRASESNVTHGASRSRLYNEWQHIKKRCYNPNASNYKFYGGRGITMCNEWRESFEVFKEWSMAHGYSDSLTLDRIDASKDYTPENCRWVTQFIQACNRSINRIVTYHGQSDVYEVMCRKLNVNTGTIRSRMKKHNISFEEAVDKFPPTAPYKSYCGYVPKDE